MSDKGNRSNLEIGSAKAHRGERVEGWLEVGRRTNGTPVESPLIVINGAHDGPCVWIQSAIHGDEYDGAVAIWRMLRVVDPSALHGALICVPVLNMSAFESRSRVSPIDHLDVNRIFPGDPTTTYTPRLAHLIENLVSEQADILVDLHGGGNDFRVTWYTIFHDFDNDASRLSRELSMVAGAPLVWASKQAWLEKGLFTRLTRQGVAAMLIECGGEGRLYEENIHAHEVSLLNMLRHLNMIDGEIDHKGERTLIGSLDFFHCEKGGFISAFVKPGDEVTKDQRLLSISDPFGREVETVTSGADGIVIAVKTYGITNGGAPVGQIAIKA